LVKRCAVRDVTERKDNVREKGIRTSSRLMSVLTQQDRVEHPKGKIKK
jgi:hypothetical protein